MLHGPWLLVVLLFFPLLLPIALKDRELRRIPWVTAAILALNVLFYAAVSLSPWADRTERRSEQAAREFWQYWAQHPYLEFPEDYVRFVGQERAQRQSERVREIVRSLEARGYRFPRPEKTADEQAEFDRRAGDYLAALVETPGYELGFVPAKKTAVTLLTSMFMHAGWIHLLGNMLFLIMSAPLLEDHYGRLIFPAFYLASGVVAAYSYVTQVPDALMPLVGASGAIAGVMGAFLVRLGTTRMVYLVMPVPILFFFRFRIPVPSWFVYGFWFLMQVAYNRFLPDSGVAWSAHIGGFLFGAAFAFAMKAAGVEEKWIHPKIEKEIGWQQHPSLTRAAELRDVRDLEGARRELKVALAAEPANADAWRTLFDVCVDLRDQPEAARAATRRLELLASREPELASVAIGETLDNVDAGELPARFWTAAAALREKTGDFRGAYEFYEAAVARFPLDTLTARALLKMAEILAKAGESALSWRVVRLAQEHPACQAGWREAADRLLVSLPRGSAPAGAGEPVPTRGSFVPRGTHTLPGAAVFAQAPAPPPERHVERPAPPAAASAAAPSAAPVPAADHAAASLAPVRRPSAGFFADSPGARSSKLSPALLWSLGGLAAAAVAVAALLVWEPWARPAPRRPAPGPDELTSAPVRGATSVRPPVQATAPPAASAAAGTATPPSPPAPTVAAAAPASGAEVPLRVVFKSPFAAGQVIVKANGRSVLTKDFDFGKDSGGGDLDEVVVVASGAEELKVWVTSQDRSVKAYAVLAATIPESEPRNLRLSLSGTALALAVE